MAEHPNHAGAFHVVAKAGFAVGVDCFNRHAELGRMIAAEMLLAAIAVAVEFLLFARDAAINDRGMYRLHGHVLSNNVANAGRKWETPAAQRAHFDSADMTEFAQGCTGLLSRPPEIDLFDPISAQDLEN